MSTPTPDGRPRGPGAAPRAAAIALALVLPLTLAACTKKQDDKPGQAAPTGSTVTITTQPNAATPTSGTAAPATTAPGGKAPATKAPAGKPGAQPPAPDPGAGYSATTRDPRALSVRIVSPAQGATVGTRFVLKVEVNGFKLAEPNGQHDNTIGVLFAVADRPVPTGTQRVAPDDETFVRSATPSIPMELPPGRHKITVFGANGYTMPFDPPVRATTTVVVQG